MFDQNEFKKYATKHIGINSLTLDSYVSAITPGIRNLTPNIIEERQLNVSVLDVFSRLMMDRIIFLGTGINDQVANIVQAQLLFLESVLVVLVTVTSHSLVQAVGISPCTSTL